MDKETTVKLENWIQSAEFSSDSIYDPEKGHFLSPIYIEGYKSLIRYIKFDEIEFTPSESDVDIFIKLMHFQNFMLDDCQKFAAIESIITQSDYGLVLKRIKTSLATLKLLYKHQPKDKPKVTLQICVNSGQSILEILEILLVPNLTLVNNFEFLISKKSGGIYVGLWLIVDSIKKSNLTGVKVALQDNQPSVSPQIIAKTVTYPPTLAIFLDDADVFSSIDRLLDMLSSLPSIHRKVDIWIQQSVKVKFAEKFKAKISKSEKLKVFAESFEMDAINPILTPSDSIDEDYIKLLTFRKVDELIGIIKRYQMIRSMSLWTSNISSAFEIAKDITNCQLFTINTIDDCPSPGTHTSLNYTNISYKLLGEPTFQNCVPMTSFIPVIKVMKPPLQGNKNFASFGIEDRFNIIASILLTNEKITPQAIDLMRKAQLNHCSFKTINKCLMLRELVPIGVISVHFDKIEAIPDQSLIFGLIGSILLYGNCCLIINDKLPEIFKQFFDKFNSIYPSSIFVVRPSPKAKVPYGWLNKDSELVGLSFGLHHLTNLINFEDCTSLFGRVRSLSIPVADQLSLTTSASNGY